MENNRKIATLNVTLSSNINKYIQQDNIITQINYAEMEQRIIAYLLSRGYTAEQIHDSVITNAPLEVLNTSFKI